VFYPPNLQAQFVASSPSASACPEHSLPEFAFIGRSNVGKSSLINMLTGRKGLAKTSSSPGKTRLINHFIIGEAWYLVDLPGFGYARLSKTEREHLKKMIEGYLTKRTNLVCTFLLIDSRLEPQQIDLDFMEWMAGHELPFVLLFTKTDKLSATRIANNIALYKTELLKSWDDLPPLILTSAETRKGRDEILAAIGEMIRPSAGA
jgi:GTP-binding protein